MTGSLRTAEGAQAFVKRTFEVARITFEREGRVPLRAYVLATRVPPEPPKKMQTIEVTEEGDIHVIRFQLTSLDTPLEKNIFLGGVKMLARLTDAVGTLLVFEGWIRIGRSEEENRELQRLWDEGKGIEDNPDRQEGIVLSLEHATGTFMSYALISRDAKGRGRLGPLEEVKTTEAQGRMIDLLGKKGAS